MDVYPVVSITDMEMKEDWSDETKSSTWSLPGLWLCCIPEETQETRIMKTVGGLFGISSLWPKNSQALWRSSVCTLFFVCVPVSHSHKYFCYRTSVSQNQKKLGQKNTVIYYQWKAETFDRIPTTVCLSVCLSVVPYTKWFILRYQIRDGSVLVTMKPRSSERAPPAYNLAGCLWRHFLRRTVLCIVAERYLICRN